MSRKELAPRCGRPMQRGGLCGKPKDHQGFPSSCRSAESLAHHKEFEQAWLVLNPGKTAQYSAAYKARYPDRVKAAQKANKDNNRGRERKRTLEHDTSIRSWLAKIKLEAGCADCGYNSHAVALDFDHLPGFEKKFNIARSIWRAKRLLEAEVEKCEIVCACCHRVRSYNRLMEKLNDSKNAGSV